MYDDTKPYVIKASELDIVVGSVVQTCSECCMHTTNGMDDGPLNVRRLVHRALMPKDKWTPSGIDCRKCPVHLHSVETGEHQRILNELDGLD